MPDQFWQMTPAEFVQVYNARMTALQEQDERESYRVAAMMALHANLNRDPKKRPQPYTADYFLTKAEDGSPARGRGTHKAQTPEQMLRAAELITRAMGGKDLRKQQTQQPKEEEG